MAIASCQYASDGTQTAGRLPAQYSNPSISGSRRDALQEIDSTCRNRRPILPHNASHAFRLQHFTSTHTVTKDGLTSSYGMNSPSLRQTERSRRTSAVPSGTSSVSTLPITTRPLWDAGRISRSRERNFFFPRQTAYIGRIAKPGKARHVLRVFYAARSAGKASPSCRSSWITPATPMCPSIPIHPCPAGKPHGVRSTVRVFQRGAYRGHVSFFFPEEGILLSGDHVLPTSRPTEPRPVSIRLPGPPEFPASLRRSPPCRVKTIGRPTASHSTTSEAGGGDPSPPRKAKGPCPASVRRGPAGRDGTADRSAMSCPISTSSWPQRDVCAPGGTGDEGWSGRQERGQLVYEAL